MHTPIVFTRAAAAFGIFISSALFSSAAGAKVEEQVVGPAPGNVGTYYLSPSGVSVASLTMKGSKSLVVVNGVDGPLIDELLTGVGSPSLTCVGAVLFSPDGATHVYAARSGDDYIVVRNGKEIYRGPYAKLAIQGGAGQLTLSPHGNHVSFLERVDPSPSQHGWRLVVDGKPGPLSANNNSFRLFYSPDDSRWAYIAQKLGGSQSDYFTVVDGKEVAHLGHLIRFTSESKMLVAAASPDGGWTLHSDGKILVKGLSNAETKVWVASAGGHVATALRKAGGLMTLWIDGKEIAASEGAKDITDVTFSPDGKHYIATCQSAASNFAIVDGKKGQDYRNIVWPQFTRDSSKALYVAGCRLQEFPDHGWSRVRGLRIDRRPVRKNRHAQGRVAFCVLHWRWHESHLFRRGRDQADRLE